VIVEIKLREASAVEICVKSERVGLGLGSWREGSGRLNEREALLRSYTQTSQGSLFLGGLTVRPRVVRPART